MIDSKIIVALDYADAASALHLVNQLDPQLCKLKVGKELFTAAGPQLVEQLIAKNFKVFLDLKFYDIPNTVASACRAASDLGVWMLNVHASGGLEMMQAAKAALHNTAVTGTSVDSTDEKNNTNKPLLIAVTVLTSMNQVALNQTGVTTDLTQHVLNLAHLAKQANLDGVVCSALEAPRLRAQLGEHFCLITPGIRPANTSQNDQSRVVTPVDALKNGASYLVIGRPITQAVHPLNALTAIYNDCQHL